MITENDCEFTIECIPEMIEIKGNVMASGDDAVDRKAEQRVRNRLARGNDWAWCTVKVTAWCDGLSASDYLGCCSYHSQEDFEKDGYFKDMQSECLHEINRNFSALMSRRMPNLSGQVGDQ